MFVNYENVLEEKYLILIGITFETQMLLLRLQKK
jgi:hypothetical protein